MSSGGRLRSPRYPPSRAPVSGTSRTSLCFTASCPQTLPACRPGPCSSHPFPPSLPCAASRDSHGTLWTLPPQVDIWPGRPGAPTWTVPERGGHEGYRDPSPQAFPAGEHPVSACATIARGPVCLSVCPCVCDSQGKMPPSWCGVRQSGRDRACHPQDGGAQRDRGLLTRDSRRGGQGTDHSRKGF